jgi:hypothetical protein
MAKMPGGAIPGLRETRCLRARRSNNALLAEAADATQRHCPRLSIPAVLAEPVTVYWPAGQARAVALQARAVALQGAARLCCAPVEPLASLEAPAHREGLCSAGPPGRYAARL